MIWWRPAYTLPQLIFYTIIVYSFIFIILLLSQLIFYTIFVYSFIFILLLLTQLIFYTIIIYLILLFLSQLIFYMAPAVMLPSLFLEIKGAAW